MNNLDAIAAWVPFAATHPAGDVTPADRPAVDFWFGAGGELANTHFHCFAHGGDGSLVAVQATEGSFERGPVVHLGHEGAVVVIAPDVPHALAVLAAAGTSYEDMLFAVAFGEVDQRPPDARLAAFVKATFRLDVPVDPVGTIRALDAERGPATRALVESIQGG